MTLNDQLNSEEIKGFFLNPNFEAIKWAPLFVLDRPIIYAKRFAVIGR